MEELIYQRGQFGHSQHQQNPINYQQQQSQQTYKQDRGSSSISQQQSLQVNFRNTHNSSESDMNYVKTNPSMQSVSSKQDALGIYILQKRSFFWDILLKTYEQQNIIVKNDQEILSIKEKNELPNWRVIKTDALRTRPQQFDDDLREKLELILTFYCVKKNITYKQGLNEVAGPFVFFLKTNNTSISTVYNYFQIFMDRFIPTIYNDAEFNGLQCYFNLFQLLLKYHDPQLYNYLSENFITPELYSTPWFLTLFANKMSLELIYYFWEIYIVENDRNFVFFISLAVLLYKKDSFLKCDPALLPQKLTQIQIESLDDIKFIYQKALQLKSSTPISFGLKIHSMQLFDKQKCCQNQDQFFQEMKEYSQEIERVSTLPIHPLEILKQQYEDKFQCCNIYCVRNDYIFNELKNLEQQEQMGLNYYFQLKEQMKTSMYQKECEYCRQDIDNRNEIKGFLKDNPILNDLLEIQRDHYKSKKNPYTNQIQGRYNNYFILDLRRSKSTGKVNSHFVSSLSTTNQALNQQIAEQFCQQYESSKYQKHFLLLINDVKSAQLASNEEEQGGDIQEQMNLSEEMALDYDITRVFIQTFNKFKFPYIGVIEGGFKMLHTMMLIQKIEIQEHNSKICHLCNKQPPKKIVKSKSKNIFERIADVFAFNNDEEETQQQKQKNSQQNFKEQQSNGLFQIDCRQASATITTTNTNNQPVQMQTQLFNRQETLSNFVDVENDESQRHIQHGTFQVKHSTPHKQTYQQQQQARDSFIQTSQNIQQVSPRPTQNSQQLIQNTTFQSNANNSQLSQSPNIPNSNFINKGATQPQIGQNNSLNIHNIASQSSIKKQLNCTVDSTTQRNSYSSNSNSINSAQVNNLVGRTSVLSQGGMNNTYQANPSSQIPQQNCLNLNAQQNMSSIIGFQNGLQMNQNLNGQQNFIEFQTIQNTNIQQNNQNVKVNGNTQNINVQQSTFNSIQAQQPKQLQKENSVNSTQINNNTNSRLPNHSQQFYQYNNNYVQQLKREFSSNQINQRENSQNNVTDRREASVKSKTSALSNKNKPSCSPNNAHKTNSTFVSQFNAENVQRKNHKSLHQFSSNTPKSQISLQNNSQSKQPLTTNAVTPQNKQSNGNQNINNNNDNKILNNLKEQFNSFQMNYQQQQQKSSQLLQPSAAQQNTNQNNLNVLSNINNIKNVTVFTQSSQAVTTPIKAKQNDQSKSLNQQIGNNVFTKYQNTNNTLSNNTSGLHSNSTLQSPFNGSQISQLNGQLSTNANQESISFTSVSNQNTNQLTRVGGVNYSSQTHQSNNKPNNQMVSGTNSNKSQLVNMTDKTPSKKQDLSQYEQSNQQSKRIALVSLTGTPQSRVMVDNQTSQLTINSHVTNTNKSKQSMVSCTQQNSIPTSDFECDQINRDSKQSQQNSKNVSQKSLSSNTRFSNQENNKIENPQQIAKNSLQSNQPLYQNQPPQQQQNQFVRQSNKSFHTIQTLPQQIHPMNFSQIQPIQQNIINQQLQNQINGNISNIQNVNNLSDLQKLQVVSQSVNASIQQAAANVANLQQQASQVQFKPQNNVSNGKGLFSSNDFTIAGQRPSIPISNNSTPLKRNSQTNSNTSQQFSYNPNISNTSQNQRFGSVSSQQSIQIQNQQNSSQQFTNILMSQQYQNIQAFSDQLRSNDSLQMPNNHFCSQQTNSSNQNFSKNILQLNQNLTNKTQEQQIKIQEDQKRGNVDFSKKEENLTSLLKRYKKSGLFKSCVLPLQQHNAFFEIFERNKFSFYVCDRLKDQNEEDCDKNQEIYTQNKHEFNRTAPKTSKSILVVSTEYVMSLKHSPALEQKIQSLKDDQQRIMKQLLQDGVANKQEKPVSAGLQNVFGQNAKIKSKENILGAQQNNQLSTQIIFNGELKIKSFFLMKTLLKITSKKHDKQMHSFYFKLPQIINKNYELIPEYTSMISNFNFDTIYDLIVNRNQSKLISHITDKSKNQDFVECKITLKIYGEENAADCIKMSQNFFQINKHNVIV
ncbi:rab-GTPase-TBC domain protein (macronuclear) [Tetrahymena thermophila SB210]|uniref:Rab-GTPase-TBC domain protein n=1 Tax=Tetrahymena thermophila (strain SB210) TaxID=312017 RepID=Q23MC5_TETTS|nr:rab-GTPase-TBC domain protein [Tetrahymena thermophila SB210]EAR97714.2 rab-GTPase-TBC domain protein [Tetrahymena thermophila SB210]|eukprot:XP_001017959.2 rab-GTPase-TBC domain protein [Tetrahymena thermophila SB210]